MNTAPSNKQLPVGLIIGSIVVIIIIIVCVIIYKKSTKKNQCVNTPATSNVSTWMLKDGVCVANVCMSGFSGSNCTTSTTSCPENCSDKECTDKKCKKCNTGHTLSSDGKCPISEYLEMTGACRSTGPGYISTDFDETIPDGSGGTTNHYNNMELIDCKSKCDASTTCKAISYFDPSKQCYLFINSNINPEPNAPNENCYKKPTS